MPSPWVRKDSVCRRPALLVAIRFGSVVNEPGPISAAMPNPEADGGPDGKAMSCLLQRKAVPLRGRSEACLQTDADAVIRASVTESLVEKYLKAGSRSGVIVPRYEQIRGSGEPRFDRLVPGKHSSDIVTLVNPVHYAAIVGSRIAQIKASG